MAILFPFLSDHPSCCLQHMTAPPHLHMSIHDHLAPSDVILVYAAPKSWKKRCWSTAYVSMLGLHLLSSGKTWSEGRPIMLPMVFVGSSHGFCKRLL